MKPIDFDTLRDALERPHVQSRAILFAALAASRAAWRARAAAGLLALNPHDDTDHKALARAFGQSVDAIFGPAMHELRTHVGIPPTEAWTAFVASMQQDYESWHDGVGFDLSALAQMPALEQDLIRQWLHTTLGDPNADIDLRSLEAAAALGEADLLGTLKNHPAADVRLRVKELLANPGDVAEELCHTFVSSRSEDAVLHALDLVASHATPEVRSALIARVARVDSTFINAAMMLLEVFGGVADAWSERPLLFRIQEQGRGGALLKDLLARFDNKE